MRRQSQNPTSRAAAPMTSMTSAASTRRREAGAGLTGLWILSALTAAGLLILYGTRPPQFVAVTIFPAWSWLVLLLPMLLLIRRRCLAIATVALVLWVAFAAIHVEEPRSVIRGWFSSAQLAAPEGGAIRIVSFNCAGKAEILDELVALAPDLVLLQESPPRAEVEKLARGLFGEKGGVVYGYDASILARGPCRKIHVASFLYTVGDVTLEAGGTCRVVSLRLASRRPRFDFWTAECWTSQQEKHQEQRRELAAIGKQDLSEGALIVGGDFNAPPGDGVFSLLPPTLYDTFADAGRGLGNTIYNRVPVLRIDQIWVSREWETLQSFVVPSADSDHRIVVSDVKRR